MTSKGRPRSHLAAEVTVVAEGGIRVAGAAGLNTPLLAIKPGHHRNGTNIPNRLPVRSSTQ